jgi:two-component system, chemotaxis family, protein-glutamate methylesterase/glutaminase
MIRGRRARILIVDDSAVMRNLLRSVVNSDAHCEVAGTAADGASALDSLPVINPDVVLLDVEMPVMDGLATLRALRQRSNSVPVIMCSSLTHRGAKVTIDALASGAADYVAKPSGQANREAAMNQLAQELIPKIRALTARGSGEMTSWTSSPDASSRAFLLPGPKAGLSRFAEAGTHANPKPCAAQPITAEPSVVVIGVSTGGPAALDIVLQAFPADFPLPIVVVQHMPELFTSLLAERLNANCRLRVHEAVQGEPVRGGRVYFARGNWHLEAIPGASQESPITLRMNQGPTENHCRPAVDVLFRSAAKAYGSGVLAVVLTGMGSDGLRGCRLIRQAGGTVLAQDEATSTVWGMPGAVANAGLAQRILPLNAITPEILRIVGQRAFQSATAAHEQSNQAVS